MPILTQPAFGPKLAIGFITGGTLIDVWALVWRYTIAPSTLTPNQQFWYSGLLLTGLTFVVIGAFLGSIGRAARKAELPPTEGTTQAEASIQHQAAANPHPVLAGAAVPQPTAPGVTPAATAPVPAVPAAPPAGTVLPRQA
jgi:hypothetical protein